MFAILGLILICKIDVIYARTSTLNQDFSHNLYDFALAVAEGMSK